MSMIEEEITDFILKNTIEIEEVNHDTCLKIRKAISLKQCKEEDFESYNNQCCLSYKKLPEYIGFLIEDILQHKDEMFLFIQGYYRSFMKGKPVSSYRDFKLI